ncbi:MAG TPA: hypothetical protein VNV87_14115 [Acidimicrobiales bacterium]|nr:hypothetical protein [Acidimicrobiales bacterium]
MADIRIQVDIHEEDGHWWADSTQLPGWSFAADSREELIARCEAVRLDPVLTFVGPWRYTDA